MARLRAIESSAIASRWAIESARAEAAALEVRRRQADLFRVVKRGWSVTRVSGSPRAITLLARTVDEVSRRLAFESAALSRAVDSTGPLLGLGTQPALAAQDLAAEARDLQASSVMLDEFVTALVAADDYGRQLG